MYSLVKLPLVISRCCLAKSVNISKILYPTIQKRYFADNYPGTDVVPLCSPYFHLKMFVYTLRDITVNFHITKQFRYGAMDAFLYISECLNNKDYHKLSEVMVPELIQKLNSGERIVSRTTKADVFHVKHIWFMTLCDVRVTEDLYVIENREKKINTMCVLIRFVYLTKDLPSKNFANNLMYFMDKKRKSHTYNCYMQFYRTYGENVKDSQWFVGGMFYFTPLERLTLFRWMKNKFDM